MIKLNETPVRTARNFNINNIELENANFPELQENEKIENIKLIYGLGDFFTSQVAKCANKKVTLNIEKNEKNPYKYYFDIENNLIDNIEITANENTESTIIIKYNSKNDDKCYHNGILRLKAKKNSNIKVIFVNLLNELSNNFVAIENVLEENAKVEYTIVDFGGKSSVTNYYSNLIGENSENNINTIYLGKENQLFDLNYIAELRGEKTDVNIEVQGALKDKSKKHFKGTIDFKKGCKKAKGNENENCILLSDTAKSIALPMLLCSEEEVEGNHSSSAGKVGEKELFYIMSRGFSLQEAMKLMVRAKFNGILEKINDENLREEILEEMEKKL